MSNFFAFMFIALLGSSIVIGLLVALGVTPTWGVVFSLLFASILSLVFFAAEELHKQVSDE